MEEFKLGDDLVRVLSQDDDISNSMLKLFEESKVLVVKV